MVVNYNISLITNHNNLNFNYRYPRPYRRGAFKIQAPLVLYLPSLAFLRIL